MLTGATSLLNNYGGVLGDAIGATTGLADPAVAATHTGAALESLSGLAGGETMSGSLGAGVGMAGGAAKIASGNLGGGVGDLVGGALQGGFGILGGDPVTGGVLGGMSQAVGNFGEAMRHTDQMDQGILSNSAGERNQFWGAMGDATIGAAHAATPLLGPLAPVGDLAITGGQLALDTVGAASGAIGGDAWRFGAGDVVGGVEHAAYSAATSPVGRAVGSVAKTGTGIAASASGAVLSGGGDLLSAASPTIGAAAGGLTSMVGSGFSGAGDMIGGRTGGALNMVGSGISNYAAPVVGGAVNLAGQVVGGGMSMLGSGLSAVGSWLW